MKVVKGGISEMLKEFKKALQVLDEKTNVCMVEPRTLCVFLMYKFLFKTVKYAQRWAMANVGSWMEYFFQKWLHPIVIVVETVFSCSSFSKLASEEAASLLLAPALLHSTKLQFDTISSHDNICQFFSEMTSLDCDSRRNSFLLLLLLQVGVGGGGVVVVGSRTAALNKAAIWHNIIPWQHFPFLTFVSNSYGFQTNFSPNVG